MREVFTAESSISISNVGRFDGLPLSWLFKLSLRDAHVSQQSAVPTERPKISRGQAGRTRKKKTQGNKDPRAVTIDCLSVVTPPFVVADVHLELRVMLLRRLAVT